MSQQKPPAAHNIPVWGIFLLLLGIVFFLQTLNILPWSLWGTFWRFWPVLIIAAGIGILLRRYNFWLVSALILALFLACLGIAVWQHGAPTIMGETTRSYYSTPRESLQSAQIEIDFTAGSLTMSSLQANSSNFVEVIKVKNGGGDIRTDFYRRDSTGKLLLSTEQVNRQFWNETGWDIKLARDIPLTLDIRSAVGNLDLDLGELSVTSLQMAVDAGNYIVRMPASAGNTRASIKADVANLEVIIPQGVAARLRGDTALSALEIDKNRFSSRGEYILSTEDFEHAKNRLELELDCAIGRVQVR